MLEGPLQGERERAALVGHYRQGDRGPSGLLDQAPEEEAVRFHHPPAPPVADVAGQLRPRGDDGDPRPLVGPDRFEVRRGQQHQVLPHQRPARAQEGPDVLA